MPQVHTFTGQKLEPYMNPDKARTIGIKLAPSTTLTKGTVLGRITASNLWRAYADGNVDGSQTARAILQYDVVTDAGGLHYYGGQAASELGHGEPTAPAYMKGDFFGADLVGLDAAGLADLFGRLIWGDTIADPNAVIHFI
jgi:head decoration protein D